MTDPAVQLSVRTYDPKDEKQVRFMVGQAQMELLAYANHRANLHPVTLAVWLAASTTFAQVIGWWPPDPEHGWYGYLGVVPAFFICAVPIILFIDWNNRPSVEARSERTLRQADMLDFAAYYTRSPSSGFWTLEYGEKLIGLIAIDASTNSTDENSLEKGAKLSSRERETLLRGKGTSATATIRHLFSEEQYRPAGIEDDLINHAIRHAFSSDKRVQTIRISVASVRNTLAASLTKAGFLPAEQDGKLGPFGWSWQWYKLERERFKQGR